MKIIVRNEEGIHKVYVQLRDIEYIGERHRSHYFSNYAIRQHNKGIKSDDFICVGNTGLAKLIVEYPYIVDFSEVVQLDSGAISRMIVLSHQFLPTPNQKADEEHKIEDLIDIINFKKGMLTYPIPVFYDNNILFDNGEVVFGSTTLPGYYMLRSYDKSMDLKAYLNENVQSLFSQVLPDKEMASFEALPVDGDIIVKFKTKNKLFSKFRKGITV